MINIGFSRGGTAVMMIRKGVSLLFERKPIESLIFGAHSAMEIEPGDEVPDCQDDEVRKLQLSPDAWEQTALTDRFELWKKNEAQRIAKGHIGPTRGHHRERAATSG